MLPRNDLEWIERKRKKWSSTQNPPLLMDYRVFIGLLLIISLALIAIQAFFS